MCKADLDPLPLRRLEEERKRRIESALKEVPKEVPLSAEQFIIISEWKRRGTVNAVQKATGHSQAMIRKTLLTAGIVPTERCRQVRKLLDDGLTIAEIATLFHTTEHNIQNYLPYQRGSYTLPQSDNAKKIAACRGRKTENRNVRYKADEEEA